MNKVNKAFLFIAGIVSILSTQSAHAFKFLGIEFSLFSYTVIDDQEGTTVTTMYDGTSFSGKSLASTSKNGPIKVQGFVIPANANDCIEVFGSDVQINGQRVDTIVERSGTEARKIFKDSEFDTTQIPKYLANVETSINGENCLVCDSNFFNDIDTTIDGRTLVARLRERKDQVAYRIGDKPMCTLYYQRVTENKV